MVVLRVTTALGMLEKRYQTSGSAAVSVSLQEDQEVKAIAVSMQEAKNTNGLQICINL